jgi:hypothetical protein
MHQYQQNVLNDRIPKDGGSGSTRKDGNHVHEHMLSKRVTVNFINLKLFVALT